MGAHFSIRDLVKAISPPWLGGNAEPGSDDVGERILYAIGLAADTLIDKADIGITARMPRKAVPSALPYLGRDRQIVRGLADTDASYAERLRLAFQAWATAGSDRGVMSQVLAFLGTGPEARAVASTTGGATYSVWRTYIAGADITQPPATQTVTPLNWDWSSLTPFPPDSGWWRFWLILYSVGGNAWTDTEGNWGDPGNWGDATASWGLSVPSTTVQTIRGIAAQWKRAGAVLDWIVVSFTSSEFDPAQPTGGIVNPDAHWGRWSKIVSGQYVPARFNDARFADGAV